MTTVTTEFVDTNPPHVWPEYISNRTRAPKMEAVQLPSEWMRGTPGAPIDRIPVDPSDDDLTKQCAHQPIGQRLVVNGRVVDCEGEPVAGALLEFWQANAAGRYIDPNDPGFMPLDPNFKGGTRLLTDEDGRFRLTTVKPAAYAQEKGTIYRPGHIHVSIFGHDLASRIVTQIYFDGDPLIRRDPIVRSVSHPRGMDQLVAIFDDDQTEAGGFDSAMVYTWDVVLRGHRDPGRAIPEEVGA